ncbi:MAG: Rid family detoxifying hydrolase [Candidatus Bipolaricaulota bacterium]
MDRKAIATTEAPRAVGPYSQGVRAGSLVATSGQLPVSPASGEMVRGDIREAARQALANVFAVLAAAGASPTSVVKVTVYLTDMADFAAVNEVYREAFADPFPARTCVAVAALPLGAPLEIEALAVVE